jgi:hypothetical protein
MPHYPWRFRLDHVCQYMSHSGIVDNEVIAKAGIERMLHIRKITPIRLPKTLRLRVEEIWQCNIKLNSYRYRRKPAMLKVHDAFMREIP